MDRTDEGLTKDKVAISIDELLDAYMNCPKGSGIVLDEAEAGLSKYRAGSSTNMAMRELVSIGRVREKYLVINLPATSELDRDLKALCSWWFLVQEKGSAWSHALNYNPYSEEPRTPRKDDRWFWDDIPEDHRLRDVYDYLHEEKLKHLRGESDESSQRLTAAEVQDRIDTIKSETKTETRNQLLTQIYSNSDLTQKQLANAVGLSRSRLADIVNRGS
jgi:AraC-like DNA-binding protein